jgi:hypothetical protein
VLHSGMELVVGRKCNCRLIVAIEWGRDSGGSIQLSNEQLQVHDLVC